MEARHAIFARSPIKAGKTGIAEQNMICRLNNSVFFAKLLPLFLRNSNDGNQIQREHRALPFNCDASFQ
jgi:hypothetical protein